MRSLHMRSFVSRPSVYPRAYDSRAEAVGQLGHASRRRRYAYEEYSNDRAGQASNQALVLCAIPPGIINTSFPILKMLLIYFIFYFIRNWFISLAFSSVNFV